MHTPPRFQPKSPTRHSYLIKRIFLAPNAHHEAPRLHRLDARPCLRPHVPNASTTPGSVPGAQSPFHLSQLGGTLPAPFFLFLSGVSMALITEHPQKGATTSKMARTTIRRGAEIFALGLLFRVQESPSATAGLRGPIFSASTSSHAWPLDDGDGRPLLAQCRPCSLKGRRASANHRRSLTQPWNLRRSRCRNDPSPLHTAPLDHSPPEFFALASESYVNEVHIFGNPQPWLFPLFPWSGFAFVGLAVGFFLFTDISLATKP